MQSAWLILYNSNSIILTLNQNIRNTPHNLLTNFVGLKELIMLVT